MINENNELTYTEMLQVVWSKLQDKITAQGGEPEDLYYLATNKADEYVDLLIKQLFSIGSMSRNKFIVDIDYSLPYFHPEQDPVLQAGSMHPMDNTPRYAFDSPPKNLFETPRAGIVKQTITLIPAICPCASGSVITELEHNGLRPLIGIEFFSFLKAYPQLKDYRLGCLGSLWKDWHNNELYTYAIHSTRNPPSWILYFHGRKWEWKEPTDIYFAAVDIQASA